MTDTDDTHESFDAHVHMVMANLPISDTKILELQSQDKRWLGVTAANQNRTRRMAESQRQCLK